MLGYIDFLLKPRKPRLFLAKPNKEVIGKFSEAYGINQQISLTETNELTFKIPYEIEINNTLIRNKNVDLVKPRYYVQLKLGSKTEWYVIHEVKDVMSDKGDAKEFKCYALPIELGDKNIRDYSEESLNAREVLSNLLSETIWTIGTLDADFELTYRTFEFNDNSILDAIYQVAETYNAIVDWNTENRTVSFIKPELHGINKGLTFSLGKYLKSMNRQAIADEMVTHLIPIGNDGLTISGINPTGRNYIGNFSYFTYPFERDEDRTVIQASDYMTNDLCHALFDFKDKFESYEESYSNLVSQLSGFNSTLSTKKTELANLEIAMSSIQSIQLAQQLDGVMFFEKFQYGGLGQNFNFNDALYKFDDLYQYAVLCKVGSTNNISVSLNGNSKVLIAGSWNVLGKIGAGTVPIINVTGTGSTEVFLQVANISSIEYSTSNNENALVEKYNYDNKQMQIDSKKAELVIVNAQINNLNTQIDAIQNDLAAENNFTQEQLEELNLYIIEKVFDDSTYIEDTDLYDAAKKKFIELQTPQISIDIDIVNFLEVVEEQRNWDKLHLGDKVIVKYEKFNLKTEAKIISMSFDYEGGTVKLTIANFKDLTDSRKKMEQYLYNTKNNTAVLNSNATKWAQAVVDTSDMSHLFENFWDKTTNEINMASNEYVTIDNKGITIIDNNDPLRFLRATHGVIGLTRSGGLRYETAISPDGVIAEMVLGKLILGQRVTIGTDDGVWLTEGPLTTITDRYDRVAMLLGLYEENPDKFGIVINRYVDADGSSSSIINKIIMNSEDGFKIQQFNGLEFKDKFYVDAEGLLYAEDITTKRITIVNDSDQIILDSYTKFMDITKFDKITTDGVLTALEKLTVKGEKDRITSEYTKLLAQAEAYATTTRDSTIRIDPTNFTGSYNALMTYLSPLLSDMDATSFIDRDEFNAKFKAYYDSVVGIINAINDSIKYSSVQFGAYFNDVLIDYISGVTATRSDIMYRSNMSGTNGFVIEKNIGTASNPIWIKQFWADLDGIIHAEGIDIENSFVTGGGIEGAYIILRDGLGGVMKLYPSLGFWAGSEEAEDAPAWIKPNGTATFSKLIVKDKNNKLLIDAENGFVDFGLMDLVGAGAIYAELLSANIVTTELGFISDLVAGKLSTLTNAALSGWSNYVTIQDNAVNFISGMISGSGFQATLPDGRLLYWVNSSRTGLMTTDSTSWPVMRYPMTEKVKMKLTFEGSGDDAYPKLQMGIGDGSTQNSGKAYITKPPEGLILNYFTRSAGIERGLYFEDIGLTLKAESGIIKLSHDTGTYVEITTNGNDITLNHKTSGRISLTTSGMVANITGNINLTASGQVNISGSQYNFT